MIALYVLLGILAFIVLVLLLPIGVYIRYDENFVIKLKVGGFKVYEIEPNKDAEPSQKDVMSDKKVEQDGEKLIKKGFWDLKAKYGFMGAVKVVLSFCNDCFSHIKGILRHIKIKRVCLNLTVSAEDAATTAIEYGVACSTVYPLLSAIESYTGVEYKNINIRSDFSEKKLNFNFSLIVSCKIVYCLIMAFKIFSEYKHFKEREDL